MVEIHLTDQAQASLKELLSDEYSLLLKYETEGCG